MELLQLLAYGVVIGVPTAVAVWFVRKDNRELAEDFRRLTDPKSY